MQSGVENLARHLAPLYLSSPTYNPAKKPYLKLPRKMQLLYQILLKFTTPTQKCTLIPLFLVIENLRTCNPALFLVYYSLDVVLLLARPASS